MDPNERLSMQMAFIQEIDKEKFIRRQTYLSDGKRKENDAEHAWHLAMMTFLLAEHANEEIDVLHTMKMLLLHDLVEIDAGDTYAYDSAGNETKAARELAAADRIFPLLPPDQAQELRALWEEFEANETPEAQFAHAMDNLQPMMLNASTDGRSWVEHQTRLSAILRRNEKTRLGSERLWRYGIEHYLRPNVERAHIVPDVPLP